MGCGKAADTSVEGYFTTLIKNKIKIKAIKEMNF